jgi:ornithine cyclodeaminase/alanine dehydrogenase-like protein (mu-crystallin family)
MALLILSHAEVESLLPMDECIAVMEEALAALARGEVHQPLRWAVRAEGAGGILGLMPAYRGGQNAAWGLKEICVYPGNPARGLDTHLGAVLLHSGDTGELLAVINASAVTAIRTAAVSAVATKLLARVDARRLAIIGSGVQARSHLTAMAAARSIAEARVVSREFSKAKRFAAEQSPAMSFAVTPVATVEEAVRDADIIVTATSSREPVLDRRWISPGTHINLVGSSVAGAREADAATMRAGSLYVDRRESTLNESGDFLMAMQEGAIGPEHIRGEIGELLLGGRSGRASRDEITIFKSLGLAIEDLASAAFLYDKAKRAGKGTWVDF